MSKHNIRTGIGALAIGAIVWLAACSDSERFRALCALHGISLEEFWFGDEEGEIYYTNDSGGNFNYDDLKMSVGAKGLSIGLDYRAAWGDGGNFHVNKGLGWEKLTVEPSFNLNGGFRYGETTRIVGSGGNYLRYDGFNLEQARLGVDGNYGDLYSIHCFNNNVCYTSGAGGSIYKTLNGGRDWSWQNSGTMLDLTAIFTLDGMRTWAAGNGVLTYTVNGRDWELHENTGLTGNIMGLHFYDERNGLAYGDRLYTTEDGGDSYIAAEQAFARFFKAAYFLGAAGWMVNGGGDLIRVTNKFNFELRDYIIFRPGEDSNSPPIADDDDDNAPPISDDDDDSPEPTPTQAAGGCENLEEKTYTSVSGNCGVSSLTVTTADSGAVVTNFGSNSNAVFEPNGNSAESLSGNLNILNAPGHTCNLDCSTPGTIVLSCANANGGTCSQTLK